MAVIELLAGNAKAAERLLSEAHEILLDAGERGYLSTVSGMLALALAKQERFDEAEVYAEEGRRIGAEDDVITQVYCRVAMAHVAAAKGQLGRGGSTRVSGHGPRRCGCELRPPDGRDGDRRLSRAGRPQSCSGAGAYGSFGERQCRHGAAGARAARSSSMTPAIQASSS